MTLPVKHSIMPQAPGFGGYDSLFTFSKEYAGPDAE